MSPFPAAIFFCDEISRRPPAQRRRTNVILEIMSALEKPNPYTVALEQLDCAAAVAGLPAAVRDILSQPKNELIINFPVRMDDG